MTTATRILHDARWHRPGARLAGAAGALAAVMAVWLIARYSGGIHVHTPGFGPAQRPAILSPGFAAIITVIASSIAWGVLKLIERTARPRRAWLPPASPPWPCRCQARCPVTA